MINQERRLKLFFLLLISIIFVYAKKCENVEEPQSINSCSDYNTTSSECCYSYGEYQSISNRACIAISDLDESNINNIIQEYEDSGLINVYVDCGSIEVNGTQQEEVYPEEKDTCEQQTPTKIEDCTKNSNDNKRCCYFYGKTEEYGGDQECIYIPYPTKNVIEKLISKYKNYGITDISVDCGNGLKKKSEMSFLKLSLSLFLVLSIL